MTMDKNVTVPMLLDVYGNILSKSQFDDLDLYYNNDLSLSEIADNVGKSRQGVFESIKKAENILIDMEEKLGFLKKLGNIKKDFNKIGETLLALKNNNFFKDSDNKDLKAILDISLSYKNY